MKRKYLLIIVGLIIFVLTGTVPLRSLIRHPGAPPYDVATDDVIEPDQFAWLRNWVRPTGPPRVGLQAGHWKNNELPDELANLRGNTGSSGGGRSEWEVNLRIAELTRDLLVEQGIEVDILPATVPPRYWADVFVAIHADGNLDSRTSGFKVATPRRDFTGNAAVVMNFIRRRYQQATDLPEDPNITRDMRGYYAFAWWRRQHAVHPMAASVIIETGFLTSPTDRRILVDKPNLSAQGLADGIIDYLKYSQLLSQPN